MATASAVSASPPLLKHIQDAIASQREESSRSQAGAAAVANGIKPSITLDLGSQGVTGLPDEFFDMIKDEVERIALSHNHISAFPPTLGACWRLRYFNARHNALREFPPELLSLSSLEVLDLSRNRLTSLPEEISNMSSLKVLAVSRNKLERLPLALGEIYSLSILKFDGNNLSFPPPEVYGSKGNKLDGGTERKRDIEITGQVKKYLREVNGAGSRRVDSADDSSEGNVETPRPAKRAMSGRFPTKASVSAMAAAQGSKGTSPVASPPPPIPSRSHYRDVSKYGDSRRRPPIAPVSTGNERSRSNSEGGMLSAIRAKRMGLLGPKRPPGVKPRLWDQPSNLTSISDIRYDPDAQINMPVNRDNEPSTTGHPASLIQQEGGPPTSPLSGRKDYKLSRRAIDVWADSARAMHASNVHSDSGGLNTVLLNASKYVLDIDDHLAHSKIEREDDEYKNHDKLCDTIRKACGKAVQGFEQLFSLLLEGLGQTLLAADRRYLRSLLLLTHGSTMEIRNACDFGPKRFTTVSARHGIRNLRDRNITPTQARPHTSRRIRRLPMEQRDDQLTLKHPVSPRIQLKTNASTTETKVDVTTPRTRPSFRSPAYPTPGPSEHESPNSDQMREEWQFEKIVLKANIACDSAIRSVPLCRYQFDTYRDVEQSSISPDPEVVKLWTNLCWECDCMTEDAQALKTRLAMVKRKDSTDRDQPEFWLLCTKFVKTWKDLVIRIRDIYRLQLVDKDMKQRLAPVAKAVKELAFATANSRWKHLALNPAAEEQPMLTPHSVNSALSNSVAFPAHTSSLPATPLSASLGPAVQATVPATSGQSSGGSAAFPVVPGTGPGERLQSVPLRR